MALLLRLGPTWPAGRGNVHLTLRLLVLRVYLENNGKENGSYYLGGLSKWLNKGDN